MRSCWTVLVCLPLLQVGKTQQVEQKFGSSDVCFKAHLDADCMVSPRATSHPMWYFDTKSMRCKSFNHMGCGSGQNLFYTQKDCITACGQLEIDNNPTLPPEAIADIPEDVGPCGRPRMTRRGKPTLAKQRYYFDRNLFRCMAFQSGAGRVKGFATVEECQRRCRPMDGSPCFAGELQFDYETEPPENCLKPNACPRDFECAMGAFFAHCCNKMSEDDRVCKSGAEPVGPLSLTCDQLACPGGNRCEQGHHVAKCCPFKSKPDHLQLQRQHHMAQKPPVERAFLKKWLNKNCMFIPHNGDCEQKKFDSSVKWGFDPLLKKCHKFLYCGAGGNGNRFDNKRECEENCKPASVLEKTT